jgi:seryl-tRNA synthetase
MDKVQKAGAEATRAYYEQKIAAEELERQINNVGVTASTRFGTTASAVKGMTDNVENAIVGFNLLNDEDLAQLRSAMDSANSKLRQMQEETQSARDRLAELNAEILEAQGQDQKAEILRQQLDYQQQLAELEKQRQDAELSGNRELLALLDQQESKLAQLNQLRINNIQQEEGTASSTERTTSSVSRLADEAERAGRAMQALGGTSLAGLNDQAADLRQHLQSVNSLL